jgi:hypothetical protein
MIESIVGLLGSIVVTANNPEILNTRDHSERTRTREGYRAPEEASVRSEFPEF